MLEGEDTALCEHKEQTNGDKKQKKFNILGEENSRSRGNSRSKTVELLLEHIAAVSIIHESDAGTFGIVGWKLFSG